MNFLIFFLLKKKDKESGELINDEIEGGLLRPDIRTQLNNLFASENSTQVNKSSVTPNNSLSTTSSQTDFQINIKRKPSFAEYQSISCYTLTAEERAQRLKHLLNDRLGEEYSFDPCLEFEKFLREPEVEPSANQLNFGYSKYRTVGSQTFFNKNLIDCDDKNTQTQPLSGSSESSHENSPLHQGIKAKTVAYIENNKPDQIREVFRLKNKENDGLSYTQKSVYTTDTKKSNLNLFNESVLSKQDATNKLVKSAVEMTSVVDNSTFVSGKPGISNEKFILQINYPSNLNQNDEDALNESIQIGQAKQDLKKNNNNLNSGMNMKSPANQNNNTSSYSSSLNEKSNAPKYNKLVTEEIYMLDTKSNPKPFIRECKLEPKQFEINEAGNEEAKSKNMVNITSDYLKKLNLNKSDDIIDIDFSVYDQEKASKQPQIKGLESRKKVPNINIPKQEVLTKSFRLNLDNKEDLIEVDFGAYDEKVAQPERPKPVVNVSFSFCFLLLFF